MGPSRGHLDPNVLQERGRNVPAAVKALFARKLLKKVAEAYGRMLLVKGLFQADCHPGNILIRDDNGLGTLVQELGQPVCPSRKVG